MGVINSGTGLGNSLSTNSLSLERFKACPTDHFIDLPASLGSSLALLSSGCRSQLGCCCCYAVAELCPALCSPMGCSPSDPSVLHYLLEFAHIHVH